MVQFIVLGTFNDPNYYYCESIAKRIADNVPDIRVESSVMFEVDFWNRLDYFRNRIDHSLMHYRKTHIVICDDTVVGDADAFASFATERYQYAVDVEVANTVLYNRNVREGVYESFKNSENPIVYMKLGQQDAKKPNDYEEIGAIYIELFKRQCPKASENFLKLCEGNSPSKHKYTGCIINRLVKNGWLQTGDVVDNTGRNSVSAEGDDVPDECFTVDFNHWRGGIIGYANEGAHTNRSQFFITLGSCPWMNNKFVGFGRVIQGYATLNLLNNVTTNNQVPARNIKILECGSPPELKV